MPRATCVFLALKKPLSFVLVHSTGIEPVLQAPQACVLSVERRVLELKTGLFTLFLMVGSIKIYILNNFPILSEKGSFSRLKSSCR